MDRRNRVALEKIVGEADYIATAIDNIDAAHFVDDETLKRAVTMSLINIGELTNAVTEDFRKDNSHIMWSRIRRTRDKVAHHYIDLDPRITWETITKSIPELRAQVEALLVKDV
jgi:uncharacterized protein with HEPN domain